MATLIAEVQYTADSAIAQIRLRVGAGGEEKVMQVVERALALLRELSGRTKGATLQELHEKLGIPVGSTHRILAVLVEQDFVTRSPLNKRYFLGPAARQVGERVADQTALLISPHPAMVDAAETTGETVFLTELIGNRAVCVALAEGKSPLRLFVRIGQDMPLHAAASARTLLAYLPESAVRLLLLACPFEQYTPHTLTTADDVIEHLTLIHAQGYDICDDELEREVWAVSAPVFTCAGSVPASVTLAAPASRMREPLTRANAVQAILTTAQRLSAELGFSGQPPHNEASSTPGRGGRIPEAQ